MKIKFEKCIFCYNYLYAYPSDPDYPFYLDKKKSGSKI